MPLPTDDAAAAVFARLARECSAGVPMGPRWPASRLVPLDGDERRAVDRERKQKERQLARATAAP